MTCDHRLTAELGFRMDVLQARTRRAALAALMPMPWQGGMRELAARRQLADTLARRVHLALLAETGTFNDAVTAFQWDNVELGIQELAAFDREEGIWYLMAVD